MKTSVNSIVTADAAPPLDFRRVGRRSFVSKIACPALSVAAMLLAGPAMAATIVSLGVLPGGSYSDAYGISADGSTITGQAEDGAGNNRARAFRWTVDGGLQNLGVLPLGTLPTSVGLALSADGSVVTGSSTALSPNVGRAFRWTAATGLQSLGVLGTGSQSNGADISDDGSVIAESSYTDGFNNSRAFRWTAAGGMENLGVLPGALGSEAFAISADGSVIAGVSQTSNSLLRAFRWTASGGMMSLGVLPGANSSFARGLSPDGSAATGDSGDEFNGTFSHAFRWTEEGGMQDLGALAGDSISTGNAISADNSTIVGESIFEVNRAGRAFLWTPALGMVDLNTYLPSLGVDLTGWTLDSARDISADGSAIAGTGTFDGATRGFLVTNVPEPSSAMLLLLGGLLAAGRRRSACIGRRCHGC